MKLGLLLIALGLGYKVYAEASKEKGHLRSLGQWVGAVMMVISFATSALLVYAYAKAGAGGICPFAGKAPQAVVAEK